MAIHLSIPIGAYNVDAGYIEYMREYDPSILPPEITNTYYGPIITEFINNQPVSFFAPLIRGNGDETPTVETMFDEIDIEHVLPCGTKVLSETMYDADRIAFFITNHIKIANRVC